MVHNYMTEQPRSVCMVFRIHSVQMLFVLILNWTAILRTEMTFAPQTTTALSIGVHPSSRQNKDNILYATHPLA